MSLKQAHEESYLDFVQRFRSLVHSYKTPFYGRPLYELFMNYLKL